ncbi:universal stress protein [Caldibacillus lycopersici]|uniref:Universal stress protein n=1 Tax=Perspicuibacillus lycopersici TaxID=1325689 RepID=A0AAE3IY62_9BACI|nr:universal stress protein [Perspicuibacillus lycopersici]MCU9614205.1 universal stress protein [Perspicuibacillus lycopersici]
MTNKYKNIIVAIDGSKEAEWAFKEAVNIAKRNDSNLFLTHIIDRRPFATLPAYDQTVLIREEENVQKMLTAYKTDALAAGIREPQIIIEYGPPKVKIAKDLAQKLKSDLIICGATGLNAMERFLIGSVSEYIVRHATCDVLVIRSNKEI